MPPMPSLPPLTHHHHHTPLAFFQRSGSELFFIFDKETTLWSPVERHLALQASTLRSPLFAFCLFFRATFVCSTTCSMLWSFGSLDSFFLCMHVCLYVCVSLPLVCACCCVASCCCVCFAGCYQLFELTFRTGVLGAWYLVIWSIDG